MNSITYNKQILQPSKVVCIGQNYMAHIEELNSEVSDQPVIFLKPNSAISDSLVLEGDDAIHYEAEISFVVINGELSGVGFGLDLTKREVQFKLKDKGLPWERSKAFDKSAVFSEFVKFSGPIKDLRIELQINGKLVQQGGVNLMLTKPLALLDEVTSFMSFEDGDILMTGTPSGVGVVNKGDTFKGKIFHGDELLIQQQWAA